MIENLEVELKLKLLDSGLYDSLICNTEMFKPSELKVARIEEYETTYFDTNCNELSKAGLTYRIRKAKGGYTATIKNFGSKEGGLHSRNEWNREIAGPEPDLKVFSDLEIGPQLEKVIDCKPLEPIFLTSFKRNIINYTSEDGSIIELGADLGEIISGDKSEPICEIELELKAGEVSQLLKLGAKLSSFYPLMLDEKSKFERGMVLSGLYQEVEQKMEKLELHKNRKTKSQMEECLRFCLMKTIKAQESFLKHPEHIETVHAFRVSLRRFRSLLSFCKPLLYQQEYQSLQDSLGSLEQKFSSLRELDVLLEEWKTIVSNNEQQFGSETVLGNILEIERDEEKLRLIQFISQGKSTSVLLNAWAWLMEKPFKQASEAECTMECFTEKRIKNWIKQINKDSISFEQYDEAAFHTFRIRYKKLRYVLEITAPILEHRYKKLLEYSKNLQDLLGNICDTGRNVSAVRAIITNKSDLTLNFEAGIFIGYQLNKAEILYKELLSNY